MPFFQALIDYRSGCVVEAADADEARSMALRIAINQITADAIIDLSQVEEPAPSASDAGRAH